MRSVTQFHSGLYDGFPKEKLSDNFCEVESLFEQNLSILDFISHAITRL